MTRPGQNHSANRIAWACLLLPLGALLLAAFTDRRQGWPALLPGEETVLMQAESLVHDGDLRYTRLDFDRHSITRPALPAELSLATGSAGRVITYDHPVLHALVLAPFVAWRPEAGHALAHAVLLALVAVVVARRLQPRLGVAAPIVVALLIFASAAFAHVFLATAGAWAFLAALAAAGLLVEPSAGEPATPGRGDRRWLAAGVLLSLAVVVDPLNLALVAGAFLVAPVGDRLRRRIDLAFGLLAGLAAQAILFWWVGGGLGVAGTERFRFRESTGFPLVDFPSTEWSEQLRVLQATHFDGAPRLSWGFDLALWGYDLLDLVAGRHMGLLVYALPVLALWWLGGRSGRRAWEVAFGLWLLGVLVLHPFDLASGPTVANARVLPLAAFVVVVFAAERPRLDRHVAGRSLAAGGLVVVAAAWVGLGGLWPWLAPSAERYPIADAGFTYPTGVARAVLPYESAQQTLPGGPILELGGLRVRPLVDHVEPSPGDALTMAGNRPVTLWVSSLDPLDAIRLDFGEDAPSTLEVEGATLGDRLLTPDGGIAFRLEPTGSRRHVLWWSPRRQSVYRLSFHFPEGPDARLRFRLVGERISEEAAP